MNVAALVRRLNVNGDGPDELTVMADPTRLVQILTNLLTNAQRYSGDVRVQWRRDGDFAQINVVDKGPGIAPDHLPRLFEMFSQVAPALERSQGGLGIGLSLVKGLVEMHDGRIWVESEPGRGSRFCFTLPVRVGEALAA